MSRTLYCNCELRGKYIWDYVCVNCKLPVPPKPEKEFCSCPLPQIDIEDSLEGKRKCVICGKPLPLKEKKIGRLDTKRIEKIIEEWVTENRDYMMTTGEWSKSLAITIIDKLSEGKK